MSYEDKLEEIISSMESRGFNSVTDELSDIKEAIGELGPIVAQGVQRRPGLNRTSPISEPREIPITNPDQKGFDPGDVYTELGPEGKEEQKLWGVPSDGVRKIEELIKDQKTGLLQAEHLFNDWKNEKDPRKKARLFDNFSKILKGYKAVQNRLSYVKEALDKKGYVTLAKKVSLINDFIGRISSVEETHELPSIEAIYEKSSSPYEFDDNLKKLVEVYEFFVRMVKKFESEYKSKVIGKIDSDKKSDKDIVKKTVELVRKADHAIYARANAMLRDIA